MRRLEYKRGNVHKFWELSLDGVQLQIRRGKVGTAGKSERKTHNTISACQADARSKCAARLDKGYVEVAAPAWAPLSTSAESDPPRNLELERALHDNANDRAAWAVYADWLQAHDDPWGEQIALSLHAGTPDSPAAKRLAELERTDTERNYGPEITRLRSRDDYSRMVRLKHHHGFIMSVELESMGLDNHIWGGPTLDQLLATLLRAPAARFLRDITIYVDPEPARGRIRACLDVLRAHAEFPGLRSLRFTNPKRWEIAESLGPLDLLLERSPRLQTLVLVGEDIEFEQLEHPHLRTLSLDTHGLPLPSLRALGHAQLPACTQLAAGLGQWGPRREAAMALLQPLFDAAAFPALRQLELHDTDLGDALAATCMQSKLLARLERLSLVRASISDAGGATIHAAHERFEHLRRFSLGGNDFSPRMIGDFHRLRPRSARSGSVTMHCRRRQEYEPPR